MDQNTKIAIIKTDISSSLNAKLSKFGSISVVEDTSVSYHHDLESMNGLKTTDILIIPNYHTPLSNKVCLTILRAMILKKSIVIFDIPAFSENINPFIRQVIKQRFYKMTFGNLNLLDDQDIKELLLNSKEPTNYTLTKHEITLAQSLLKSYFREVLSSFRQSL